MPEVEKGSLAQLAAARREFAVRVNPRAARNALRVESGGIIRISVTAPPERGRANEAARRLLARALGVAPGRLVLLRGAAARDKLFGLDQGSSSRPGRGSR